ncbi:MAG: hypothetical protein IH598_00580 [Bacteroidales bacterium]|nr:hypothetical protein [Bacteroidales bacterium]
MKKIFKIYILCLLMAATVGLQAQVIPGTSLSFDGTYDYVSGTKGISTSLTAITIEVWVFHNIQPWSTHHLNVLSPSCFKMLN